MEQSHTSENIIQEAIKKEAWNIAYHLREAEAAIIRKKTLEAGGNVVYTEDDHKNVEALRTIYITPEKQV